MKYYFRHISPSLRILLIIICAIFALHASPAGTLQLRSFSPEAYHGGSQNWCATSDSVGRIYVGNSYGLMIFDGSHWYRNYLPNYSTIRSIRYAASSERKSDRLYVAGSEEFGYFRSTDTNGELIYTSLIPTLPSPRPKFTEIWNIILDGSRTWFQTDNHLFVYDGKRTRVLSSPGRISTSALINGNIYVGLEDGRICITEKGKLMQLSGIETLADSKITGILPLGKDILIATMLDGLYLLSNGRVAPLTSELNPFLRHNQLFCTAFKDEYYLFGTVTGGAVVKNFRTNQTFFINRHSGLQNNTVLNAYFDDARNLWLCLDNGLDYALLNSPITNLIGSMDDIGSGYSSVIKADDLYIGTNQGLFSTSYPIAPNPGSPLLSQEAPGQIWSINDSGSDFFVAGDAGIYAKGASGFYKISGLTGGHKVALLNTPGKAIASCYDGFHLLVKDGAEWRNAGIIKGNDNITGNFYIDSYNNLWINHWMKGIYRLHYNESGNNFDSLRLYGETDGLPAPTGNSLSFFKGAPIVYNIHGFFTWNRAKDKIVKHQQLNSLLSPRSAESVHVFGDSVVALINSHRVRMVNFNKAGGSFVTEIPYSVPSGRIIPGFENLLLLPDNKIIIGNNKGFWLMDATSSRQPQPKPKVYVNRIYANADSLVYRALMNGNTGIVRLPYSLNSLRFEFGTDFYTNGDRIQFSTRLENFDEDWSPFNSMSTREFTKLREGSYRLNVRIRINNDDDLIYSNSFDFTISPPWYRSIVAKIIYILIFIALIGYATHIIIRWKRRAEKRIMQRKEEEMENLRKEAHAHALRKDYEIATLKSQQLEIEVKHKSSELSSAAMNIVRKNEMLNDISVNMKNICNSEEISETLREKLLHLISSIDKNISNDSVWDEFKKNFDVVYNDFIRRLQKQFPELTSNDIRMCCYIKSGLSSKEIAPLINISVKSVEMARYRLRKKMNLSAENSLTEFLIKF